MFGGMFPRKPSKEEALKTLQGHAALFGALVLTIRVTPHVLKYLQKDDITFDF